MEFDKVTVCGGGILGSQIAWQTALCGFNVTIYDIDDKKIEMCKGFHKSYAKIFKTDKPFSNLRYTTNLKDAVSNASIVIESITENMEIKKKFYEQLSAYIPDNAVVATNSSTITPSKLKNYIKKPERFLALHFANPVWEANIAEIMGHDTTNENIFKKTVEFAQHIKMIPIKIYKEQKGYVLNAMLIPWLASAQYLYFTGIADYKDIDKAWIMSTKSKIGPFGIMDIIGLRTIYNIILMDALKTGKKELFERAEKIKESFLDKGKLGLSTKEGFYKYPNPEYENFANKQKA